jgi:Zn-dependent protease with chaperone function
MRYITSYDFTTEELITDGDKQAVEDLKSINSVIEIIYKTIVEPRLKNVAAKISITGEYNPKIESLASDCADILSLERLPIVNVSNVGQSIAMTTGTESDATIIIESSIIPRLSDQELKALIGHEMGHIKSHHLKYHAVAEQLERGIVFSESIIGMNLISMPVRMALMSWHRESEISADRASLIVSGELSSAISMFMKILGKNVQTIDSDSTFSSIFEVMQTHPNHLKRIKALQEFSISENYNEIKKKLKRRKTFEKAFIENCRFCGSPKQIEDTFCPNCGKSLI